jgi:hypothetical protein
VARIKPIHDSVSRGGFCTWSAQPLAMQSMRLFREEKPHSSFSCIAEEFALEALLRQ